MVSVWWVNPNGYARMTDALIDLGRCPHCSIAAPQVECVWSSEGPTVRLDGGTPKYWGTFICRSCGGAILANARFHGSSGSKTVIDKIIPAAKAAHEALPDMARTFLQQAYETLHAPDAATVMAASAVDAMLKAKGYEEGNLYTRIDRAVADNVLTQGMATWAHSVRLEANSVRHADLTRPHASPGEARQTVEFAEALGNFLFVLTARIERGIAAANAAES